MSFPCIAAGACAARRRFARWCAETQLAAGATGRAAVRRSRARRRARRSRRCPGTPAVAPIWRRAKPPSWPRSASAPCCCSASRTRRTPRAAAPGMTRARCRARFAAIKAAAPISSVWADVCLCEYTDHGHCGVLDADGVDNDATLPLLARAARGLRARRRRRDRAVRHDGRPRRRDSRRRSTRPASLDRAIVSYAVKYASAFYGPFREAAGSTPQQRRSARLPDGSAERARGDPRSDGRRRGRRRHGDGEAGPAVPRCRPRRARARRRAGRGRTRCRASTRCCTPPPSAAGSICRARDVGDGHRAAPRRRRRS